MRIDRGTTWLALPALLAVSPLQAQLSTSTSNSSDADCAGLTLTAAGGVPDGAVHGYKFQGVCKILTVQHSADKAIGFTYDTDKDVKVVGEVWAIAAAKWDSKTGKLTESVKTSGSYAGELEMVLMCAKDPVITSVTCHPVAYKNTTNWPGFDGAWIHARPITRGKTTLAEAAAFSKKAPPKGATPPPPPPAPKPGPKPSVPRLPAPTTTGPVASQPVVTQPAPLPAPHTAARRVADPRVAPREVPLVSRTRIKLASGRSLSSRLEREGLRWAILGPDEEVLRLFPAGSRAFRSGSGNVTVNWGGGVYDAGPARR